MGAGMKGRESIWKAITTVQAIRWLDVEVISVL